MEGAPHDRGDAGAGTGPCGAGPQALIVSASYRSDIPAFHADRFLSQLSTGHADVRNPWSGRDYRVSLAPEDVDGFVFWTRNARPFRAALQAARRIAPCVVQYTLTGYPRALERGAPSARHAIGEIRHLVRTHGPGSVVWRYDPVLWTTDADARFHRDNFNRLADALAGLVDEVVLSAATLYAKSRRNLKRHSPDLQWRDPDAAEKRALLSALGRAARARGMAPRLCSQPHLLDGDGELAAAQCIDARRLQRLGGKDFAWRSKGARPGCACAESRDIGAYDSCAHGCFYCYAVSDHDRAARRLSST